MANEVSSTTNTHKHDGSTKFVLIAGGILLLFVVLGPAVFNSWNTALQSNSAQSLKTSAQNAKEKMAGAANIVPVSQSLRTEILKDVTERQGLRTVFEASIEEDIKLYHKAGAPNTVIMKGSFTSRHSGEHLEELEVIKDEYGHWYFQYMD